MYLNLSNATKSIKKQFSALAVNNIHFQDTAFHIWKCAEIFNEFTLEVG